MTNTATLSPERAKKLIQSAIKLYEKSRHKEARKKVVNVTNSNWADPNTFFQLGVAAQNSGDFATSMTVLKKGLSLNPTSIDLKSNMLTALGSAMTSNGLPQDAILIYNEAAALAPGKSAIYNNRGIAKLRLGYIEQSIDDYKKAHELEPGNANIAINLADLYTKNGFPEKALNALLDTYAYAPANSELNYMIGVNKTTGTPLDALTHLRHAFHADPSNEKYQRAYSEVLVYMTKMPNLENMEQDLIFLLGCPTVSWANLNRIVPLYLKSLPAFKAIETVLDQSVSKNVELQLDYGQTIGAISNNLFLASLQRLRIIDPLIERLLELFRRQTLAAIVSDAPLEKPLTDLLQSLLIPLSSYMFMNEYVFVENEFERASVENLIAELQTALPTDPELLKLKFLILACYRPLYKTAVATDLQTSPVLKSKTALQDIISLQISEPQSEWASYANIQQLTAIEDDVSQAVREQYEENPYPRWQHLHFPGTTTYAKQLAGALPVLEARAPNFPASTKVLIAGCGTGRQPISTARSFPETDVLAVDLSQASLAYAMRKAKELAVDNISFRHGDIMNLGELDQKFDIIECAGVLHHMKDPVAGWRILCDLLKDDGYMLIGLYSELGRQPVVASRQFIKDNNYGDSVEDIRNCRKAILALDNDHPTKTISIQSDFYTTSACRDLIFHVQEYRFTILEIKSVLDDLGMEFCGFMPEQALRPQKYAEQYPDDKFGISLDNWDQFETDNPDTFTNMYKFWIRKKQA
jgi:SAM-dependent methyltransferase/Flp pilus assembly protein TadD